MSRATILVLDSLPDRTGESRSLDILPSPEHHTFSSVGKTFICVGCVVSYLEGFWFVGFLMFGIHALRREFMFREFFFW